MCVIRFQDIGGERTPNEVVWQAMLGALSVSQEWPKVLIAVDDDIDPTDLESVFWAVSFRYQPHRDTKIIQGRNAGLDQSAAQAEILGLEKRYPKSLTSPQGASSILMDATRKWEYTPTSLPKKHYMENAKKIWQELGFPELKPREPWYGVNLGVWPQEYQHQAELGEKGEFEKVAEIIKSKRRNV
jgi:4-hydroxy-3-polyprenylbenzoate decarboxylase